MRRRVEIQAGFAPAASPTSNFQPVSGVLRDGGGLAEEDLSSPAISYAERTRRFQR